jgi:hypothetical protein
VQPQDVVLGLLHAELRHFLQVSDMAVKVVLIMLWCSRICMSAQRLLWLWQLVAWGLAATEGLAWFRRNV